MGNIYLNPLLTRRLLTPMLNVKAECLWDGNWMQVHPMVKSHLWTHVVPFRFDSIDLLHLATAKYRHLCPRHFSTSCDDIKEIVLFLLSQFAGSF